MFHVKQLRESARHRFPAFRQSDGHHAGTRYGAARDSPTGANPRRRPTSPGAPPPLRSMFHVEHFPLRSSDARVPRTESRLRGRLRLGCSTWNTSPEWPEGRQDSSRHRRTGGPDSSCTQNRLPPRNRPLVQAKSQHSRGRAPGAPQPRASGLTVGRVGARRVPDQEAQSRACSARRLFGGAACLWRLYVAWT